MCVFVLLLVLQKLNRRQLYLFFAFVLCASRMQTQLAVRNCVQAQPAADVGNCRELNLWSSQVSFFNFSCTTLSQAAIFIFNSQLVCGLCAGLTCCATCVQAQLACLYIIVYKFTIIKKGVVFCFYMW